MMNRGVKEGWGKALAAVAVVAVVAIVMVVVKYWNEGWFKPSGSGQLTETMGEQGADSARELMMELNQTVGDDPSGEFVELKNEIKGL